MTINEAINVLGLKEPFTQDDLKKAYKRKLFIYHPDKLCNAPESMQKEAEAKTKKFNEARTLLKQRFKNNNAVYGVEQTLREQAIKEIKAYEDFFDVNELPSSLHIFADLLFNSIKYYIQVYSSEIDFMDKDDEAQIKHICKMFLKCLEEEHKRFFESIRTAYKVPKDYKANIEFTSNTRILWLQMVNYFEEYNKYRVEYVNNKIKQITETYSTSQLYLKIKSIIKDAEDKIKINISKLSLKDIDDAMDELELRIKKFESQYARYTNLIERLKKLEVSKDTEIFQLTGMFEKKILTNEFEQLLNGLEKIVVDNEVKLCVDKIHKLLLNKYNLALSKLEPSKDIKLISQIHKTMLNVSYILECALDGKVKLEELVNLYSIEFIDFYADSTIIEKIKFSTYGQDTFDMIDEIENIFKKTNS